MAIEDFTPADMQILMMAIERVSLALRLTDSEEDMAIKARITSSVVKCAEGGERDLQRLIDGARGSLKST